MQKSWEGAPVTALSIQKVQVQAAKCFASLLPECSWYTLEGWSSSAEVNLKSDEQKIASSVEQKGNKEETVGSSVLHGLGCNCSKMTKENSK